MRLLALFLVAGLIPSAALAGPYDFTVVIAPTPMATAKLAALKDGFTVAVSYFGDPSEAAVKRSDEGGLIELARVNVGLPAGGGQASISGAGVRRERLGWLTSTGPQVNINVFTRRRGGADKIVDCDFFQDTVVVARRAPVRLACRLVGEK
ncbi:MAG TPA: hypothetical protein VIJ59_09145 [Caulobacteraceae bacterium]